MMRKQQDNRNNNNNQNAQMQQQFEQVLLNQVFIKKRKINRLFKRLYLCLTLKTCVPYV